MVAGMVMLLVDLRTIYELLFRDGVMVAKKDKRPQCMHPEIQGMANLKVIRAMGSLKSKGFVRETFAWKHSYWYLTNEGIVYLRDYLRLPPEIVPSSLQRVRRPASTLDVMRRSARGGVQTVDRPTSYVPKPRVRQESQESMMDRQGYRHKRGPHSEEEASGERPAMRFRGSYQGHRAREPGAETQTFIRRCQGFRREEQSVPDEGQRRGFAPSGPADPTPEARVVRSPAPARDVKPFVSEVPVPAPVEPAFIATVKPEAPAPEVEEVVKEVAVEAPMPVEEAKPEEEKIAAVEPAEVIPDVWEQEEPKPAVEEIEEVTEEAPAESEVVEVVEAFKEEVLESAATVEELEEEFKPSAEASDEESVEEVEDVVEKVTATEVVVVEEAAAMEAVLVKDVPEVPAEDLQHDADIKILEESKEVVDEPSTHEKPEVSSFEASVDSEASEPGPVTAAVAIEAESEPVIITETIEAESEQITTTEAIEEVEASIPLPKNESPEPDLPTPPPPVTEDFTDLTEYHQQTVIEHMTQEIPAMGTLKSEMPLEVTSQVVTSTVTSTVYSTLVEKETQISQSEAFMEPLSIRMAGIVSQLGLEQDASSECTAPVIPLECPIAPLECPIAAPKSSLPQGDWAFLTKEHEEEEEEEEEEAEVKISPDSLEGLSSF